jgi:hypothetical protein
MVSKNENNLIHLRFNPSETITGKKDILMSEISLLKIGQNLSNYKKLRLEEIKRKEKIQAKIKLIKKDLAKLHRALPKIKIPKILEKENPKIEKKGIKEDTVKKYGTVEDQLKEIQARLKSLE